MREIKETNHQPVHLLRDLKVAAVIADFKKELVSVPESNSSDHRKSFLMPLKARFEEQMTNLFSCSLEPIEALIEQCPPNLGQALRQMYGALFEFDEASAEQKEVHVSSDSEEASNTEEGGSFVGKRVEQPGLLGNQGMQEKSGSDSEKVLIAGDYDIDDSISLSSDEEDSELKALLEQAKKLEWREQEARERVAARRNALEKLKLEYKSQRTEAKRALLKRKISAREVSVKNLDSEEARLIKKESRFNKRLRLFSAGGSSSPNKGDNSGRPDEKSEARSVEKPSMT